MVEYTEADVRPNLQEERDFLFYCFFGLNGTTFDRFISRAYRDWCRTFRGAARLDPSIKRELATGATARFRQMFRDLERTVVPEAISLREQKFDQWHRAACVNLKNHHERCLADVPGVCLTYGQCQKWLNMLIKYCWVCGGAEWRWCEPWFLVAHIPVDQIILKAAVGEDVVSQLPCKSWATWDNCDEYLAFQEQLRLAAEKRTTTPLELEFEWWEKYSSLLLGNTPFKSKEMFCPEGEDIQLP